MFKLKQHIWKEITAELLKVRMPYQKAFTSLDRKKIEKQIIPLAKKSQNNLKKIYWELTTARNRNLLSFEEQNRLRRTVCAFFGLSVGFHGVTSWMLLSRSDKVIIADPDIVSITNLNRLPLSQEELGKPKTLITKKYMLKINPFVNVVCRGKLSKPEIDQLFETEMPDLIIDEIDDLVSKVHLRMLAKKFQLPLICATDVGDNVFLDVERYDQKPIPEPFLGRVANIEKADLSHLSANEKRKLIFQIVGFEGNSQPMLESLMAISGTISTWPQLGSTATIAGGVIATTIKKIVLGEAVKSGRYHISLDSILDSGFNNRHSMENRQKLIDNINYLMEKNA